MGVHAWIKAGILALGIVGLSACGQAVDRTVEMEAELTRLAEEGDISGRLFLSLKEHHPQLYADFLAAANEEMKKFQSPERAGYKAGERMRAQFIQTLSEDISQSSDENVSDMIAIAVRTYRTLGDADPQECFRNVKGLPPKNVALFTEELMEQEFELMIKVFEDGRASGVRAANQAEINAWIMPIATTQPDIIHGLGLMEKARVSDAEAKQVCDSMIGLMGNLQRKPVARRALLFRGMLKMAAEQGVQ